MESLINREIKQPALPAGEGKTLDDLLEDEERGALCGSKPKEYRAVRLFERQRWAYDAVVILTAENWGIHRIGALLHIGTETIEAVRTREGEKVGTLKGMIARTARRGALLAVEEIHRRLADRDRAKEVGNEVLAKWLNDLIHAAELLTGGVTERTENIKSGATGEHDTFARYLESLSQADAVALPTGSEGEEKGAQGNEAGPSRPAGALQDGPGPAPAAAAPGLGEYDDTTDEAAGARASISNEKGTNAPA